MRNDTPSAKFYGESGSSSLSELDVLAAKRREISIAPDTCE